MTRSELIQKIVKKSPHLTPDQAEQALQIFFHEITSALREGRRVELRGFGSFCVRQRAARLGRNPRTGAPVSVEQKRLPFFKAGRFLIAHLNSGD